jgi:assimilatory nitrate reductase catalytic subunit
MARADATVRSGQAWLPMHWGKRFLGGRDSAGINTVTSPAFDPHSRQPELKHAAVKVAQVELAWRAVAFAEVALEMLSATLAALQALQSDVVFTSMVPMGRDRPGLLVRAANNGAPADEWLRRLDAMLGLEAEDVLRYDDPRRGHSRRIRIAGERLVAVRLAGEEGAITSGEWLRGWLLEGRPVAEIRRLLLSPARHAPSGFVLAGRTLCQCHNVSEAEAAAALAEAQGDAAQRLEQIGRVLKCGSNCGSCRPELRALAAKAVASAQPEAKVVAWQ